MGKRRGRTGKSAENRDDDLEREAQSLLSRPIGAEVDSLVVRGLRREIEAALGHLRDAKTLYERERKRLVDLECDAATDLLHLNDLRRRDYSDARWGDRQSLKARLAALADRRLGLALEHSRRMRDVRDRLVTLLNRHAQLTDG